MSPLARYPLTIEYALLGFLRSGELHGYEIHRRLSDRTGLGRVWRLKQSHLYALLSRLEADGLIASHRETQATRPTRRVFALTPAGEQAFADWVESPVAHGRELRLDFMAKLYFARQAGAPVLRRLVAGQRAALEAWHAEQQERAEAARAAGDDYGWLVEQFRAGQLTSMLTWLETYVSASPAGRPTVTRSRSAQR